MENTIKIFENEEFGQIRTLTDEIGKVLFCGTDVAKSLGYANVSAALTRHCKGVTKRDTLTNGGIQALSYITEGDVYRLIAHSRLPSAEKFESWVFDDVLPTIRKAGGYVDDAEMFVETYLPFADEPIKQLFKLQFQHIGQLNDRIRREQPLVEFAEQVADTTNVIDMNKMSKLARAENIEIGRNRLYWWLRDRGILMDNNIPYQEYIERGYFKVIESIYETRSGKKTYQQTYITGKGQLFIIKMLKSFYREV